MNLKAVLFDFDGTLVQTQPHKIRSLQAILKRLWGMDPSQVEKTFLRVSGNSRRDLLNSLSHEKRGFPLSDSEFIEISREFSKKNLETILGLNANSLLRPGVLTILKYLDENGIAGFVSSAAVPEEIRTVAKHVGISAYFKEILGSENAFKKGKPHIEYICEKYSYVPQSLCFLGDEVADIELNLPTGVKTYGIVWDRPEYQTLLKLKNPHGVVQDMEEFLGVIQSGKI